MRHAFDADHIAAIGNTTRKLVSDNKRPLTVGFWFSLGHSSIVFGLCLILALGVRALAAQVENENSGPQQITVPRRHQPVPHSTGIVNLVSLLAITKVWRRMKHGQLTKPSSLSAAS